MYIYIYTYTYIYIFIYIYIYIYIYLYIYIYYEYKYNIFINYHILPIDVFITSLRDPQTRTAQLQDLPGRSQGQGSQEASQLDPMEKALEMVGKWWERCEALGNIGNHCKITWPGIITIMTCTIQSMPSMHDSTVHDIENPWTSQSMEDDGSILQRHFCRTMQTCGLHRRGVASAHPSSCTTPWSPQGAVNIEINCCSYILYIHIIIYIAYIIYIYT